MRCDAIVQEQSLFNADEHPATSYFYWCPKNLDSSYYMNELGTILDGENLVSADTTYVDAALVV